MTTKVVSLEKIESNRRNARRSTGPRTEEGKSIAKLNAVKHGILSAEVVVPGLGIQEQVGEFQALRERFWKSLARWGRRKRCWWIGLSRRNGGCGGCWWPRPGRSR